ncbi:radical SAM protein [Streptomyces sp.]|uniref:radical SAM protein n=1 Tax=Streptomyces sp. TaxID=1931 RepID=UPI002D766EF3|nr:radical SAM protein [Streptomyces sp.]HET6355940.1 radical SAM protein [Streptomyces sp.]
MGKRPTVPQEGGAQAMDGPADAATAPKPGSTGPRDVIWDITYACPLRCTHCYSESGRRPAQQPDHEELLRIADAIITLRPGVVSLAGGEPLLVPGIVEIAARLTDAGVQVVLYTGGWRLTPGVLDDLADVCHRVVVSLDGATARVHDRIRGRAGSFERALEALGLLDRTSRARRGQGLRPVQFGVDCVVVRSNFDQLEEFCTLIAPRFPELRILSFGAVIPAGLASRTGFADHELLSDAQMAQLSGEPLRQRLTALAPSSVLVLVTDNLHLQMHPVQTARGLDFQAIQVEPDGAVRAMPVYEGTVGNLLTDPAEVLWQRAVSRWSDPFVIRTLTPVRTVRDWAEAARRIDYRFGSDAVRARIDRRPDFVPLDLTSPPPGKRGQ